MIKHIDQLGRAIELNDIPNRIISLVPSQTELLHYLGLEEEVVGITKFCVHPEEWHNSKKRVGGTKDIHYDWVQELLPDLIIGNKEENEEYQVNELMQSYPVWISDINSLEDALEMILALGEITGTIDKAMELAKAIQDKFDNFQKPETQVNVAYFIWQNPYMVVRENTFVNDMLNRCGFVNVFQDKGRYPTVTDEEIADAQPDLILLSSEPFPFKEKHVTEIWVNCPTAKTLLVDGEMFSWYGSRLLRSVDYFQKILGELDYA
ncbi:MAG: ABC transporter substrate-binding protein [Bacteroidia bacterium]|nr:ABC transporter substrate-binding protein [Bacteroidia bacterium]